MNKIKRIEYFKKLVFYVEGYQYETEGYQDECAANNQRIDAKINADINRLLMLDIHPMEYAENFLQKDYTMSSYDSVFIGDRKDIVQDIYNEMEQIKDL